MNKPFLNDLKFKKMKTKMLLLAIHNHDRSSCQYVRISYKTPNKIFSYSMNRKMLVEIVNSKSFVN